MKKTVFMTLALLLALVPITASMIGCGGEDEDEGEGPEAPYYRGLRQYESIEVMDTFTAADIAGWGGGSFSINSGSTTISVTHSLGGTPTAILPFVNGDSMASPTYEVGTFTATNFTLSRSGTDTASRTVYWMGTTE